MSSTGTSFFSKLPTWARIVFILVWPVSLAYGVYRMWKTNAFSQPVRIAATAIAVIFTISVMASSGGPSGTTSQTAEAPDAGQTAAPATSRGTETAPKTQAPEVAPEPELTPPPSVQTVTASVTRIVDGDTIEVRMPDGSVEKIRFIGVDTPESTTQTEPYGQEASAFTSQALTGKTVYLETDAELRDRYGRLLAHVWLEVPEEVNDAEVRAHLFNAHLLLAGYANLMTIPPNVKYVDYLGDYEREARTASVGLWEPAPAATPPPAAATAPAPQPAAPSASYIANRNTGKFHKASCSSVDDMNESNKVPYDSREAVIAAGYIPCKRCNP